MTNSLVPCSLPQIMESAIRLCYSSLPSAPLPCLPNGARGSAYASSATFHHAFNRAYLCASHFPTLHPIATRSFRIANCMPDRLFSVPSNNDNDNDGESDSNKVLRGMTGISLVLAFVLGLFNFNSKMNPMFKAAYAFSPFPGGRAALQSLLQTMNAEKLSKSNRAPPRHWRDEPDGEEVKALKLYAVGLSKSGKQPEALKILQSECEKYKGRAAEFNLEMALVELLIFQENFEDARKRLDDRIDEFVHEKQLTCERKIEKLLCDESSPEALGKAQVAQLLLYKAIIHTMLEDDEAAKWWEAFGKTLNE